MNPPFPEDDMEFSKYFDHTLLRPDATREDIRSLIDEALQYDFAAVCVNGCHVRTVEEALAGSGIRTAAVVGFPLGAMSAAAKAKEARIAIEDGADEIDMVMNIGAAKDGDWNAVGDEIRALVRTCAGANHLVLLKVILETCLLNDEEIVRACRIAKEAGADFVKTSTGFSFEGATVHAVRLMRQTVGEGMGVKASGGIRNLADAKAMLEAGASRLGCSASAAIMEEYQLEENNTGEMKP